MGAGASANETAKNLVLDKELASREEQGRKLGAEYEVTLLKPQLTGLKTKGNYILRVGYEALVLTNTDEAKTPITYFKYQDIICWGSSPTVFQFKIFGAVLSKAEPIAIVFETKHGKTLEKVTLSSVHALMADMDKAAVTKADFESLKGLLQPSVGGFVIPTASGALEASDTQASSTGATEGGRFAGGNDAGAEALFAPENDESEGADFVETVKQFAESRRYTVHQAIELMNLAKKVDLMDAFDKMDFAMFLWASILNRDSFQLVINVFEDEMDRENIIARVKATGVDRASAALLRTNCPDHGGGFAKLPGAI